jgi:regulatory protein
VGKKSYNALVPDETHELEKCREAAFDLLSRRLQSEAELKRKLLRKKFDPQIVDAVVIALKQKNFLDDRRFAATKSMSAMQHKHHGRRRAYVELLKSGVKSEVANEALDDVYNTADSVEVARQLAMKKARSLKQLDPVTARRRLAGMLQRRGFEYEAIKAVIDDVLGGE